MEKYIQPTIFDEKGRPESSVVSAINEAEVKSMLAMPEQQLRALKIMEQTGKPLREAIAIMYMEDAQDPTNDAHQKNK